MKEEVAAAKWCAHEDMCVVMELCHGQNWRWDSYQVIRPFCLSAYR
jgi:hypothetical protein